MKFWYYRPLTKLVFGLASALWGTTPWPYHAVSLLAHGIASVLVYFVARRAETSRTPAFAGTLLFAVHFRNHESVFWFSAISYPLSTCFGLASALLFRASLEEHRRGLLAGSLLASFAAMLTKDTAAVVPALAALYGLLFAGGEFARATRRGRLAGASFLSASCCSSVSPCRPSRSKAGRSRAAAPPSRRRARVLRSSSSSAPPRSPYPASNPLPDAPRKALALAAALGLVTYALVPAEPARALRPRLGRARARLSLLRVRPADGRPLPCTFRSSASP